MPILRLANGTYLSIQLGNKKMSKLCPGNSKIPENLHKYPAAGDHQSGVLDPVGCALHFVSVCNSISIKDDKWFAVFVLLLGVLTGRFYFHAKNHAGTTTN